MSKLALVQRMMSHTSCTLISKSLLKFTKESRLQDIVLHSFLLPFSDSTVNDHPRNPSKLSKITTASMAFYSCLFPQIADYARTHPQTQVRPTSLATVGTIIPRIQPGLCHYGYLQNTPLALKKSRIAIPEGKKKRNTLSYLRTLVFSGLSVSSAWVVSDSEVTNRIIREC